MPAVTTQTIELDGQPVFLRRAGDDEVPILYLHDVPTSSYDWLAILARGGGIAPDLPGFGRSGKRGDLDYTMRGHADFLQRLLDALGVQRVRLCMHGWGVVGLLWAMADPSRVERLVVIDGVPLLAGHRWHRWARVCRTPGLGEIAMGSMSTPVLRHLSRGATGDGRPLPAPFVKQVREHFDQGTQRALLHLLRASPPEALAEAGAGLPTITAPGLVLWGEQDPYVPVRFGAGYAAALGDATLETVPGAGHWPWIERPEVAERVVGFLEG